MASEGMGLVPFQGMDNNLTSHLPFQDENPVRFSCSPPVRRGAGEPGGGPKPGLADDKMFTIDQRDRYYSAELRQSGGGYGEVSDRRGDGGSCKRAGPGLNPSSGDDDEDEDEDEDDGEDDDDDDEDCIVEGLVRIGGKSSLNSSGGFSAGVVDQIGGETPKDHASFGSSARLIIKDDGIRPSTSENGQQGRLGSFQQMVTMAEHDSDIYCSQLLQGTEGSSHGQKDVPGDNGCGFSGRKDSSGFGDPAESLRAIFSDPITGSLMDDAMILPCGHSFGGGGIQQVIKMKACYTCSRPISEDSVAPNLSLQTAVQAFQREKELLMFRASKRRRERFEQKGNYGDPSFSDTPRGRGVQFPFAVTDRVLIKGNKRTPLRFVGREAIVMTQCLNGWYVVKTLDNAESVKLQYRSLEKVSDKPATVPPASNKMTPKWL